MCAIVGLISLKPVKFDYKRMSQLLLEMDSSGKDSTGIAYFDGKTVNVFKSLNSPKGFVANNPKTLKKIFSKPLNAILLHARQATAGDICLSNAQPILETGIVLIHNGNITNARNLAKAYKAKRLKKDSDTALLTKAMSKAGDKKMELALNEAVGGVKVAYFKLFEEKTLLNFYSDTTFSFKVFYDKKSEVLMFANEEDLIKSYYSKEQTYFGGLVKEALEEKKDLIEYDYSIDTLVSVDFSNGKVSKGKLEESDRDIKIDSIEPYVKSHNRGYGRNFRS